MVINPGGTIASPINLVTVAASVVLANKLLSGDANNDFQIIGSGKLQWGPGGASALDTAAYRVGAGQLRIDSELSLGQAPTGVANSITVDHVYSTSYIRAASLQLSDTSHLIQADAASGVIQLGDPNNTPAPTVKVGETGPSAQSGISFQNAEAGSALFRLAAGVLAFGTGTYTAPTATPGSGTVLLVGNVTTAPSTNPVGGGVIYCEAGALKYRGTSGTVTVLGAA